jgi:hypothetical protein
VLYLYIRSGDVWKRGNAIHWSRQPPCSFYFDAMHFNGGVGDAEVIAEDDQNPCVPMLTEAGVRHIRRSIGEDIAMLMHAHKFANAVSSFPHAMLRIGRPPKTLYAFNAVWPRYLPHMVCWETEEYAQAMKPWIRSEAQIRDMKRIIGCRWVLTDGNKSRKVHYFLYLCRRGDIPVCDGLYG